MKKTLLALSVSVFAMASAQAANQVSVEFLGNIQAVSCNLNVNGQNQVVLGSVTTKDFTTANTAIEQGKTDFTLNLTGCDAPAKAGTASFKLSGDTVATTDSIFLQKSANAHSNAGVMILKDNTPLKNGDSVTITTVASDGDLIPNSSVTLTAAYGSTAIADAVTTGTFKAPVLFSFVYQ